MSRAGRRAVDGEGVWRVVRNLTRRNIELRTATVADSDDLFNWRNDPAVRAASRIPDIIDRNTHQSWVVSSLTSIDRILLIGDCDGSPVGVVRFDLSGIEAEISIYLVPGPHPPGQGRSLLQCAERWLAVNRPEIARIRARVLAGNERSARLFLGAGYVIEFADYSKRIGRQ
jgi:RimJ/RimL family protein N-acetyltransferase